MTAVNDREIRLNYLLERLYDAAIILVEAASDPITVAESSLKDRIRALVAVDRFLRHLETVHAADRQMQRPRPAPTPTAPPPDPVWITDDDSNDAEAETKPVPPLPVETASPAAASAPPRHVDVRARKRPAGPPNMQRR